MTIGATGYDAGQLTIAEYGFITKAFRGDLIIKNQVS
jgi:hypothetical protein